jgi:hypothetical protein
LRATAFIRTYCGSYIKTAPFRAAACASCWVLFACHLRPCCTEPELLPVIVVMVGCLNIFGAKYSFHRLSVALQSTRPLHHVINARVQGGSCPVLGTDAWVRIQHQLHQISGIYSMQSLMRPCRCNEGVSCVLHHGLSDLPLQTSSEFDGQVL